jgi:flagellar basal-body rod protein FlgB
LDCRDNYGGDLVGDVRVTNDEATEAVRRILDLAAARQKAAVKNLANIDTEGYRPTRIEFSEHLKQASGRLELAAPASGHMTGRTSVSGGSGYVEVVDEELAETPEVGLERTIADLADAEIAYTTAARIMSKRVATLRTAITGKP